MVSSAIAAKIATGRCMRGRPIKRAALLCGQNMRRCSLFANFAFNCGAGMPTQITELDTSIRQSVYPHIDVFVAVQKARA
jgi:hypothetical protein